MWHHLWEICLHAIKDTLPLLPWILLMYVLIELLESKTNLKNANKFGGKLGPLIGSATGTGVPQEPQNFTPSASSVPQFVHFIFLLSFSLRYAI